MNDNYQAFYWSKLDNVAKLYSLVSSTKATNVFRISVKMIESIQPDSLSEAVIATLLEMPSFSVRLRRGIFWYYFDMNIQKPRVRKEFTYPCSKMTKYTNNGYLFNISYYENMIHLEVFHALADGSGALQFLKVLLYQYVKRIYPSSVDQHLKLMSEQQSQRAMDEDSFLKVVSEADGKVIPSTIKAYKILGIKKRPQELKVIHGMMPAYQIVQLSKKYGVSISCFLSSLLIYSIYMENARFTKIKRPITVTIPFDLRARFESNTVRNFFSNTTVSVNISDNVTFEEILNQVSSQLIEGQDQQVLTHKIKDHVTAQQNLAIRFVPLFLKNMVMKQIYLQSDQGVTTTLSNLGRIVLPDDISQFVEQVRVMIPVTPHQRIRCGVCSFKDTMAISFTSSIEETDIQRFFFRFLREQEIEITISCNEELKNEILY